jgi:hypothetical protein
MGLHKSMRQYSMHVLIRGVNVGGVWGGGSPPQRNDPVGLKLSAVGLKIMLFTCSALRSKLNILETRDRLKLFSIEVEICSNGSNSSEIICRNITYLFREFMNESSVKTRAKGWSFHLLSKHGDIYMSRLRVGTFIWNLGSARSFTGDILY